MRGTSRWALVGIAFLLVVACSVGSRKPLFTESQAPQKDAPASLAGIGDPYYPSYGNAGYDVQKYALKVRYQPSSGKLTGSETITAQATADLTKFDLDFHGLTIDRVQVNDQRALSTREGDELVITPAVAVTKGSGFTVTVDYSGTPQSITEPALGSTGFLKTTDGAIVMGEPESATTWFPVNDHPRDKALYDIELTIPSGLSGLSNGVPSGQSTKDGETTWRWQVNSPMAPYLATLVIGNYRVSEGTCEGKPMITGVSSSIPAGQIDQDIARTCEITGFLAQQFGPYPFDAYGGIVINDDRIGFALETQTRPVYSGRFWRAGGSNTVVMAHELAHQWYGDSVSVDTWQHIWLNEGFATYAQWLWQEHIGGPSVQNEFDRRYNDPSNPIWDIAPGAPGRENLFSGSVYQRGGMTLVALRKEVGDEKFLQIMRDWASSQKDGLGTSDEFIALAQQISGKDLGAFFTKWLFTKSRP
jgi:aminopeptidase N